jgi:hypothetical protein
MNKSQLKKLFELKKQLNQISKYLEKYLDLEMKKEQQGKLDDFDSSERFAYWAGREDAREERELNCFSC